MNDNILQLLKEEYESGLTFDELSERYKIGRETIRTNFIKNNIPIRSRRIHQIDKDVFKNLTNDSAWLLGFTYADGFIGRGIGNIYHIRWEVSIRDKDILEIISRDILKSSYPIMEVDNDNKHSAYLSVGCKEIYSDLLKWGIKPRKTYNCQFPTNLPSNMYSHFIRGIFDGDGCITFDTDGGPQFKIIGLPSLIIPISEIIHKECNTKKIAPFSIVKNSDSGVGTITYTGRFQVQSIREWLYKEARAHLHRKKVIFDQV